jgi:hypothetical protein
MKPKKGTKSKKKRYSKGDKVPKGTRTTSSTFEEMSAKLRNAGWGKDKLTQELEQAFYNIGVSFIKLKPHFDLLKKANEIFIDTFEQMTTDKIEKEIACLLFGRAFGCFLGAVRLSSSGQMTETWVLLRALIENCLYAFYMFESPERADIWVNRHKDEDSKKKCKDTFKVGSIWVELKIRSKRTANEAKTLYDKAIDWGAHPNERSLFPNIVPKPNSSGLSLCLVNANPAFIRASVIYTIRTSLFTFRIFNLVFPEVFGQPNVDIKIKNLDRQIAPLMTSLAGALRKQARNSKK